MDNEISCQLNIEEIKQKFEVTTWKSIYTQKNFRLWFFYVTLVLFHLQHEVDEFVVKTKNLMISFEKQVANYVEKLDLTKGQKVQKKMIKNWLNQHLKEMDQLAKNTWNNIRDIVRYWQSFFFRFLPWLFNLRYLEKKNKDLKSRKLDNKLKQVSTISCFKNYFSKMRV